MKKMGIIVLGILLAGGMVWTVFGDYLPWMHAERDNFGHGPGEQGAAGVAGKMYQETTAGVRINYPEDWKVRTVWGNRDWKNTTDVAIFTPPAGDIKVTISRYDATGSLVDLADKISKEKAASGYIADERQYISGKTDVTVLTWRKETAGKGIRIVQIGMAKSGNSLVTIEAESSEPDWKIYSGRVWEIYKSLVLI